MRAGWLLIGVSTVVAFVACGSDDARRKSMPPEAGAAGSPTEPAAGAAGGGGAPTQPGGESGAPGEAGSGGMTGVAGSSEGGAGGAASAVLLGIVQGAPLEAVSGIALPNEAASYIEFSIQAWDLGCDRIAVCDKAQLNFTLYATDGVFADIVPGTYPVGDDVQGGVTFNVVGGAGRYDVDCGGISGTFSGLASGSLTIDSLDGGVTGSVDFMTEAGEALSGPFSATDCTL